MGQPSAITWQLELVLPLPLVNNNKHNCSKKTNGSIAREHRTLATGIKVGLFLFSILKPQTTRVRQLKKFFHRTTNQCISSIWL